MRRKRAKHFDLNKRIRPILVASILLLSLMISPFSKPLAAKADTVSAESSNSRVLITKTIQPLDSPQRTFKVDLTIKNINKDYKWPLGGYNKLKSVVYEDIVSNEFSIVNKPNNATVNGNTVTKNISDLSQGDTATISYIIKAKDNISGSYPVNTSQSNVSYKYSYYDWGWNGGWKDDSESINIKPPTANVEKVIVTPPDPDEGKITLNKTAVKINDGEYRINFDIAGKLQKENPKKADIILLIDKSNSMLFGSGDDYEINYKKQRITFVKNAATKLVRDILGDKTINKNGNIRISVADFNYEAERVTKFISDENIINKAINNISITENDDNGGTNTEAGIRMVGEMLGESERTNQDAKRYVVMFTDGLPTAYVNNDGNTVRYYQYSPDIVFGNAQEAYNDVIGGITYYGGIGYSSPYYYYDNYYYNARKVSPQIPDKKRAKFYSIGYKPDSSVKDTLDNSKKQADMMENFLKTTQNVIAQDQFASKYCTNDVSKIESIFEDITDQLKQSLSSIVDNAVITDVISDEFAIPEGVKSTVKVSVNNNVITKSEIINSIVKKVEGQKIILDLSKVPQQIDKYNMVKISVSFIVKVRDEYFSSNGINTNNGNAVLNYDDPKSKEKKHLDVISPKVDIAPVEGSIYINKDVDLNGLTKEDKTVNDFPIYIDKVVASPSVKAEKSEKYGFQVAGGSTAVMNFYLKGPLTDVSKINNASDKTKNYITAGNYKVSEIVPMDYSNVSIKYSYDNVKWNSGDTFKITKDNRKVYIRVENKLVNNTYWRDWADSSNEFALPK